MQDEVSLPTTGASAQAPGLEPAVTEDEHAPVPVTPQDAQPQQQQEEEEEVVEEEHHAPPPAPALAATSHSEHTAEAPADPDHVPAKRRASKGKRLVHFIRRISHTEKK